MKRGSEGAAEGGKEKDLNKASQNKTRRAGSYWKKDSKQLKEREKLALFPGKLSHVWSGDS